MFNKTKEFIDLMQSFERQIKSYSNLSLRLDREPKELWDKSIYYQDGNVNEFFRIYMLGYMQGRSVYMNQ